MASLLIEMLGWIGASMVVIAYFLLTQGRLSSESRVYHSLNLLGSFFVFTNAFINGALPSAAINLVWALIGVYGLSKSFGSIKSK